MLCSLFRSSSLHRTLVRVGERGAVGWGWEGRSYMSGSVVTLAGEKWRESQGRDRSGNRDGPLHDLSDYVFEGERERERMKLKMN